MAYVPVEGAAFVTQVRAGTSLYRLDTLAAFAVAVDNGIDGSIADGGHMYGPWWLRDTLPQLAAISGGTPYDASLQQWAWASAGIGTAITEMANSGARGLTGAAAVTHLVKTFERPTDVAAATTARLATFTDLQSRGSSVWGYLAGLAGGPSLQPAPLSDLAAQAAAAGSPYANAGWRDLLFSFSRSIPAGAATLEGIARRLPKAVR